MVNAFIVKYKKKSSPKLAKKCAQVKLFELAHRTLILIIPITRVNNFKCDERGELGELCLYRNNCFSLV